MQISVLIADVYETNAKIVLQFRNHSLMFKQ